MHTILCAIVKHLAEVGESYYFRAITDNPSTNNYDYHWKIYPPAGSNLGYDFTVAYGKKIYFTAPIEGMYRFTFRQNGDCGWSDYEQRYIDFSEGFGFGLMMSPNPSTEETRISIEPTGSKIFDENDLWELEIYKYLLA